MVVKYQLIMTADSKNIETVKPEGGLQNPNLRYFFKLYCGNCGESTEKKSWVCLNHKVIDPQTNRHVHLHQKCKYCEREGQIKMVPIPQKDTQLLQDEDNADEEYDLQGEISVPLMMFECDGLLPFDFALEKDSHWEIKSKSGNTFVVEVDLSNDDWSEWDDDMQEELELLNCSLILMETPDNLDALPYGCTICERRFKKHNGALSHGGEHHLPRIYLCYQNWCGRTTSTDKVKEHVHVALGTRCHYPPGSRRA